MSFTTEIENVSTNGRYVARVRAFDTDSGEVLEKSLHADDAIEMDAFSSAVERQFGAEAAGCVRNEIEQAARNYPQEAQKPGIHPVLVRAADVAVKQIDWFWTSKLALGKVNLICGDPGANKSTLTLDMAARTSTGTPWPDSTPCPTGSVILISAEDGQADTSVPRLIAARADLSKIHFFDGINMPDKDGGSHLKCFTLEHIAALEDAIKQIGDCTLVVIDPVSAFLADSDSHKNAEIRGLLAPLAKLADECNVCIVLVTHLNKAAGGKAIHRAMGSLAFVAAARSAWLVAKDNNNDSRRLFLPIKNNLGDDTTGMAFTVIRAEVPSISWEHGAVHQKADDALAQPEDEDSKSGPEPEIRKAAVEWLRELLTAGPVESSKVKDESHAAGMSWATIRRAKDEIGIKPYRCRSGGNWLWRLPVSRAQVEGAHVIPTREQPEQPEQPEHLRSIPKKIKGVAPYTDERAQVAQVISEVGEPEQVAGKAMMKAVAL